MRKFLSTVLLTLAVLCGKSQVILNEVYMLPGDGNHEFFELYNTSTDPTAISLDCYSLVVMYAKGTGSNLNNLTRGFYILDFPNVSITPKSYLIGASASLINAQKKTNIAAQINWNALTNTSGSLKKYELRNGQLVNITTEPSNGIPTNFNDLFSSMPSSVDVSYAFFLFNGGVYVNGLIGGGGVKSSAVPISITGLPDLTVSNSCGNFLIDWSLLANAEFVNSTDGADNGYERDYDGNCGTWIKSNSSHTPGTSNGTTTATTGGTLATTQTRICGTQINFQVLSSTSSSAFPIEVQLYEDYGTAGSLDASDAYVKSHALINSGSTTTYSYTQLDPNKEYLFVYKTNLGCLDKVVATPYIPLKVKGSIPCAVNANNKRTATYSIESADPATFPITLKFTEDNATPDNLNDDIVSTTSISSTPFTEYVIELVNGKSNVKISAQSTLVSCATTEVFVPNDCTVLPVHFQSFNATRNKEKKEQVVLKWITATEQNNRGFNVQRKVGGQWKNIAYIFSQAENGNSSTALAYEYKDMNVLNTVTQYQIQQVDYDGKTSYSDIKAVPGMEQKKAVLIYPNPGVDGKINLLFSELGGVKEVIVSDMNGRIVKQYRQVTENNLSIEGLLTGFYTIKITDRTTAVTTVEKVIIR